MRNVPFSVYVISDLAHAPETAALRARETLAICLRDKLAEGAALLAAAEHLVRSGHRLYVHDRIDVALAAGAEGVHLGGASVGAAKARAIAELVGARLAVGVSTHAVADVVAAHEAGADFCVLSPIFASPGKGTPIGLAPLVQAAASGLPVYALGGVTEANAADCLRAGATGVAAIRAGLRLAHALCP